MKIHKIHKITVLLISLILSSVYCQTCTTENLDSADPLCQSNGFCVGSVETGCSCKSGYSGSDCSENIQVDSCVPERVIPTATGLDTDVSMEMHDGVLKIDVEMPYQENDSDNRRNHARWTKISFERDQEESCAYPSSIEWSKRVSDTCTEVYSYEDVFSSARNCFEVNCYDSRDRSVFRCDPNRCSNPPCRKEYKSIMTIERSFMKSNGRLGGRIGSSSRENLVKIVYPWIQPISRSSPFSISVLNPPNSQNMVLSGAEYNELNDEWIIRWRSSLPFPWRLSNTGSASFGGFPVSISYCPVGSSTCVQEVSVRAQGCRTFEEEKDLSSDGIRYVCNAQNEGDCPNPRSVGADFALHIDAITGCLTHVE